eukprot:15342573-Alexandrium_andersonii.AAC.1
MRQWQKVEAAIAAARPAKRQQAPVRKAGGAPAPPAGPRDRDVGRADRLRRRRLRLAGAVAARAAAAHSPAQPGPPG